MRPSRLARWAPVVTWAALILVGTSLPPRTLPAGPVNSDKLAHLLLYGVLGALFVRATLDLRWPREHSRRLTVLCIAVSFACCAAFGAVDEWHQQFVARSTDLIDWLADAGGALAGSMVAAWFLRRRHWRSEHGGGAADQRQ